jgi:hypothetical protein
MCTPGGVRFTAGFGGEFADSSALLLRCVDLLAVAQPTLRREAREHTDICPAAALRVFLSGLKKEKKEKPMDRSAHICVRREG